ncbi:MAG TPA: Na-translocating system protein MpsC family protein [Solirubrobacteraceae bacterium]|jgi:uncharacterized protein YbcI
MESDSPLQGAHLNDAISVAMVDLYERFYGHGQIRARTFIDGNVVVCVLEDILTTAELRLVGAGGSRGVIDGRVAFQEATEDEFTAAVEHLTRRRVVAFLSANQTNPGVACELFFLAPPFVELAVLGGQCP